jgi:Ca2+-binding EF-hand superfamily protein
MRIGMAQLSAAECGMPSPGPFSDAGFMRFHPVLAALDADHDGVISVAEIANAPAALVTLDQNRDGLLTAEELLPMRNP